MTDSEMNDIVQKTQLYIEKTLHRYGYSFLELEPIEAEVSKATNDRCCSIKYINTQVQRRTDFSIRFLCDGSETFGIAIWAKALDRPYSYMAFSETTTVDEEYFDLLRQQQPGQSVEEYLKNYFAMVNQLFDGEWNKYIMGKDFKPYDIDDRMDHGVSPKPKKPKLKIVKNDDKS